MNKSRLSILFATIFGAIIFAGCSVGTKVLVTADELEYPVSQTSSFYTPDGKLAVSENFEILEDFEFTFTKWGVSSVLNIDNQQDISSRLNAVIEEHNGSAITNLTISVYNPPVRNGLMLFVKTVSLTAALISIPVTAIEPSQEGAVIALSSSLIYLFTPAAADIKIEGTVVRFIE